MNSEGVDVPWRACRTQPEDRVRPEYAHPNESMYRSSSAEDRVAGFEVAN
jgi:hypothetical protein